MADEKSEPSKAQRFAIVLFSGLFMVLLVWLLGFVTEDIGSVPGPDFGLVQSRYLDPALLARKAELAKDQSEVVRLQKDERDKQSLLRDSTGGSKETMNQLLEVQKLGLDKGVKPSPEEQKALADSEQLFLGNQQKYQACNEKITALSEKQRHIEEEIGGIDHSLDAQGKKAEKEHQALQRRHNIKLAALKLLVLIPLLFLSLFALLKWRHTLYVPFVYTTGAAVLLQVVWVMHEHFPTKYFKYLLILAALAIVIRIMVFILKSSTAPKSEDWRVKAYRDAYQRSACPVCAFPVKPGALRTLLGSAGASASTGAPQEAGGMAPYTCPACGTLIYERCSACHGLRHSLLPFCEKCGTSKLHAAANVAG